MLSACITQARPKGESMKGKSLSSSTNIMGPLWDRAGGRCFFGLFMCVHASVCSSQQTSLRVQPVSRLAQTAEVITVDHEVNVRLFAIIILSSSSTAAHKQSLLLSPVSYQSCVAKQAVQ